METPLRVIHYLNQFFGGIGGEEAANQPVLVQEGPVGSGRALQQVLGERGSLVATIVCGDNYFNDEKPRALEAVVRALREIQPDVVIAGPAFEAGRYGLACVEVCKAARDMGIPAVTGMHPDNPGVLTMKQEVLIVPTGNSPSEMQQALSAMTCLALKLATGEELGPAAEEGYIPRGIRKVVTRGQPGYKRSVDMLVAKLKGLPFRTEVPMHLPERVQPTPAIANLREATIALVTTGGLVRKGNPDKQTPGNAQYYHRHAVEHLESLSGDDWQAYHSGYFNHIVNSNPNYILPLSFMRELEAEGVIGGIYPWIYALPGVGTPVGQGMRLGEGIARELKEAGVDGCIMVST